MPIRIEFQTPGAKEAIASAKELQTILKALGDQKLGAEYVRSLTELVKQFNAAQKASRELSKAELDRARAQTEASRQAVNTAKAATESSKQAVNAAKANAIAAKQVADANKLAATESSKLAKENERLAKANTAAQLKAQAAESAKLAKEQAAAARAAAALAKEQDKLAKAAVKQQAREQAAATKQLAAEQAAAAKTAADLAREQERLVNAQIVSELRAQAQAAQDLQQGYTVLGAAAASFAAAVAGIGGVSLDAFADFERQLNLLQATSRATPDEIEGVRAKIEELGRDTSKLPQEIAELAVSLNRAGFTLTELEQGLGGVVKASEATGTSLATTGDVIAQTIRGFQLPASESERVADLLVQTANSTNTSISSLGETLKLIAPIASQSGQSLEEVLVGVGLLGDVGIRGSRAGTNLAEALKRLDAASAASVSDIGELASVSEKAVGAFEALQVDVRDTDGSLKPLSEIIPIIQKALQGLNTGDQGIILKTLFGERGQRAFGSLINLLDKTPGRIQEVQDAIRDSAGATDDASAAIVSGFSGSVVLLESSLELASIKIGEFASVGVKPLVDVATLLINTFVALPAPIQGVLVAVGAFAGALAAAVAAVTAYNIAVQQNVIANVALAASAVKTQLATIASASASKLAALGSAEFTAKMIKEGLAAQLSALAQNARALATGKATEAQKANIATTLKAASTAGAFAGALAAIQLNFDVFTDLANATARTRESIDSLDESYQNFIQTQADAAGGGKDLETAVERNRQAIEDTIGVQQKFLDNVREAYEFAINNSPLKAFFDANFAAAGQINDLFASLNIDIQLPEDFGSQAENRLDATSVEFNNLIQRIEQDTLTAFDNLKNAPNGLGDASAAELAAFTANVDTAIQALEKERPTTETAAAARLQYLESLRATKEELAAATAATGIDTSAIEDQTGALDAQAQQLDQIREDAKAQLDSLRENEDIQRDRGREDAQIERQRALARENALIERQNAEEIATLEKRNAEEIAAFEKQQAEQLQAAEKQFEEGQARLREESERRIQAAADAFNRSQEQRSQQFQARQQTEAAAANDEFARRQLEIDRQLQLEQADPGDRAGLREQFAEEDQQNARRQELEAGLRADQAAFEAQQRAEQQAFEKEQQGQQLAFETTVLQPQREALEAAIEARRLEFEANVLTPLRTEQEAAIEARRLEAETAVQTLRDQQEAESLARQQAEEDFQRQQDRQFEDEQRAREAAFKDEQRRLDAANAEQIAEILRAAGGGQSTPTPSGGGFSGGGRRAGGTVNAGTSYMVGEGGIETFVPQQPGYILHNRDTALAQEVSRQIGTRISPNAIKQLTAPNLQLTAPNTLVPQNTDRQLLGAIAQLSAKIDRFNGNSIGAVYSTNTYQLSKDEEAIARVAQSTVNDLLRNISLRRRYR